MGNSNDVGRYVGEEELNRMIELELKKKLKKQIKKLEDLDSKFYIVDWNKSQYKNGGYGKNLYYFPNARRFDKYPSLTIIFLVRTIYFWYSNSKC